MGLLFPVPSPRTRSGVTRRIIEPSKAELHHHRAARPSGRGAGGRLASSPLRRREAESVRSEEHTSELQSLMSISYAVFCLKKKTKYNTRADKNENTKNIHMYMNTHQQ